MDGTGLSNFDVRHRFVVSYIWEIPAFRSREGMIRRVLGGWQLNGFTTIQSGRPFVIQDSSDPNLDGVASDRPDVIRNPNLPSGQRTVEHFFDTGAFGRVPAVTNCFGNAGRDIIIGPGYRNFDISLIKRFHVFEKARAEFRWEIFNLFNHPNFDNPGGGARTRWRTRCLQPRRHRRDEQMPRGRDSSSAPHTCREAEPDL